MNERKIETKRGIKCRVLEAGQGAPVVFFHGAGGLLARGAACSRRLARRFHVYAPEWPGYGADGGEEKLDDMLDFALHGWDVVEALGLERAPEPGRPLDGRHDRRRDGLHREPARSRSWC